MNKKTKNILLSSLGLLVYLGFMIGFGFIWNLFWHVDHATTLVYWISKGVVCLAVVLFAIVMMLDKADKGIGAVQLMLSVTLSVIPLVLRAICMIPTAGLYIAIVLGFILVCLYAITMIGLFSSSNGSGNKKI